MMIYSKEHGGYTMIHKSDDVCLIDTAAAHQCGNKVFLIVVNASGKVLVIYDSLNLNIDTDNKKITFVEDKNNECTNIEDSELKEATYYINGNMFNK